MSEEGGGGLPGCRVPQPHGVVCAGAGQGAAVGAEGHGDDIAAVGGQDGGGLPGGQIPQSYGRIGAGGGQGAAVRAERRRLDRVSVAGQGGVLSGGQVQQLDSPVHARAAGEDVPAGVERQRVAGVAALPGRQCGGLSGGQIPQPDGGGAARFDAALPRPCLAAGQGAAVGTEGNRPDRVGGPDEGGDLPGGGDP